MGDQVNNGGNMNVIHICAFCRREKAVTFLWDFVLDVDNPICETCWAEFEIEIENAWNDAGPTTDTTWTFDPVV
jgi:transcription elongation factor Elf1